MVALREQRDVSVALTRLAGTLESLEFGTDTAPLAALRDQLAGTIRGYLIPRTMDRDAPMTVVLTGPTGSGKSTLLNSLLGHDLSATGALRPTTRSPVVVAPAGREAGYRSIGGVVCEVVSGPADLMGPLTLVDSPDLDSTSTDHRVMAETLIDNADIVVFVTSALRYADEVPWQVLRRAVSRGAPVINVLNRVSSATAGAAIDFRSKLAAADLDDEVVTISEHFLAEGAGRVPASAVTSLRERLTAIVGNRDEFADLVFDRVLGSTLTRAAELARELDVIAERLDYLEAELSLALAEHRGRLDLALPAQDLYQGSRLVDWMVAAVEADIRQCLVEESRRIADWDLDPTSPLVALRSLVRESLAACADEELDTCLDLIYQQAALYAAEPTRARQGDCNAAALRASLGPLAAVAQVHA